MPFMPPPFELPERSRRRGLRIELARRRSSATSSRYGNADASPGLASRSWSDFSCSIACVLVALATSSTRAWSYMPSSWNPVHIDRVFQLFVGRASARSRSWAFGQLVRFESWPRSSQAMPSPSSARPRTSASALASGELLTSIRTLPLAPAASRLSKSRDPFAELREDRRTGAGVRRFDRAVLGERAVFACRPTVLKMGRGSARSVVLLLFFFFRITDAAMLVTDGRRERRRRGFVALLSGT